MDKLENMKNNENNKNNETSKTTFTSLTPDILEENKQVYTEALDYAFSQDDIRNIAITGVYGAGKSTVWNTYKKYKTNANKENSSTNSFENIITISIGSYDYYSKAGGNKDQEILKSIDWEESRIERLIIKQMLAQIKQDKIPLAKYQFKKNKNSDVINEEVSLSGIFVMAVLLWMFRDSIAVALQNCFGEFNAMLWIMFLSLGALFYAGQKILFKFFTFNKLKFSTIKFQGAEANFKDEIDDEIGLEKNSKEIVYLLASSKATVVVFEDLDRFNKNVIYSKLKELNYLLNSYLKTNEEKRIVKFVYLIRDGLFYSKDRTKFFDYILPIVPIVDSNTSVDTFLELLRGKVPLPHINVLVKISLYVDDMRIIRNIVNEYIVYANVLPMESIELKYDNLFSIITFKNIFPNEFQLLQEDKGFIKQLIKELEDYKENQLKDILAELQNVKKAKQNFRIKFSEKYYGQLKTLIPKDVELMIKSSEKMVLGNFLKEWGRNKKRLYKVKRRGEVIECNFDEFMHKFIFPSSRKEIKQLMDYRDTNLKRLKEKEKETNKKYGIVIKDKWRDIINKLPQDKRDDLFANPNFEITKDHYFPLIRYLLISGLLDETYWYYMTNFINSNKFSLTNNDIIFMKGLLEGTGLDLFFNIDNPKEILDRLSPEDYLNPNVLNYKLFRKCIQLGAIEPILGITASVRQNNNYSNFIKILEKLEMKLIKQYIDILIKEKFNSHFQDILEEWIDNQNLEDNSKLEETMKYISSKKISSYKPLIYKFELSKEIIEDLNYSDSK